MPSFSQWVAFAISYCVFFLIFSWIWMKVLGY